MTRVLIAVCGAMTALSAPLVAQTVAEQLQKAIHAQETAGDYDEAIRIYRQIIASSPSQRAYAAQAQLRLAQTLLQKGDLTGAAAEYQILAARHGAEPELITTLLRRTHARNPQSRLSVGVLSNGRYRHNLTGIEFSLPEGWTAQGDGESSGGGQMLYLSDAESKASGFVWMKPYDGRGDLAGELRGDLAEKPSMRDSTWKVRPDTVQMRTVGGEHALSAVADYLENGKPAVEYLTWIRTPRSRLLYSVRVAASNFHHFQARFDQLIYTVRIP